MTYAQLQEMLYGISPSRLQDNVTVKMNNGEFYPIGKFKAVEENDDDNDVLDVGHHYLEVVLI